MNESAFGLMTEALEPSYQAGPDGLALSVVAARKTRVTVLPTAALVVHAVTLEAWVYPRSLPGPGARMAVVDDPYQFSLFVYEGGAFRCSAGGVDKLVPGVIKAGVWTSIACTFDGAVVTLWINGVSRTSLESSSGGLQRTTAMFVIGENERAGLTETPDRFDGFIDNVRIWRRARSKAELCGDALGCTP